MSDMSYRTVADLPEVFPIFPLPGALLFPRGQLPLNIFEPRYLNMIDDALVGDRVIGMVQTTGDGAREHPSICRVGCLGRLASFSETDDGRYLITLEGVCRFVVAEEQPFSKPYREAKADWGPFTLDLTEPTEAELPERQPVLAALQRYIDRNQMKADWDAAKTAPMEALINALCSGCPFTPAEKQALVEAPDLKARCDALIALLDMDVSDQGGSPWLQ